MSQFPLEDKDLVKVSTIKQTKSNNGIFDPFFGIKVVSPRISLETFNVYCKSLTKIKISALTNKDSTIDAVIMGVIVHTSGIKRSEKGNDYLMWYLNNLTTEKTIKLLLFGEAAKMHSKLRPGCVVAVTNAELVIDNLNSTMSLKKVSNAVTLKVQKSFKVFLLGVCPDFGICASLKKDGSRCSNYVNLSNSSFCSYHIEAEASKFRSLRGSLSAVSNERTRLGKRKLAF